MDNALEKVHEIVENAMLNLVLHFATYARFIVRIGYTYKDFGDAMACTDGKTIYINDRLIAEMNSNPIIKNAKTNEEVNCTIGKEEMIFILCHEAMHLLTATMDRAENLGISKTLDVYDSEAQRKVMLWNMATDYAINSLLINNEEDWQSKPIGKMPEGCLYNRHYKNMTAEEIYKKLLNKSDDIINEMMFNGLPFKLDKHIPITDEMTKSGLANKINEVFGSKQNGLSNSSIDRFVKNATKPVPFNWRTALNRYIRGYVKENYTWNKSSRAGIANGLILPSSGTSPYMHLAIAVDTSGSISDNELQSMFNHIVTILAVFKNFTVDLWCCGSKVYEESFMTFDKQHNNSIKNFKVMSDGGNDMRENFKFIKTHYRNNTPDVFVCLTDGYDPIDGDNQTTCPCPVVWLIIDHPQFTPPSKMKCVVYPYIVDEKKNESY